MNSRRRHALVHKREGTLLIGSCWNASILLKDMAGTTRLELATGGDAAGNEEANQSNQVIPQALHEPIHCCFLSLDGLYEL